MGTGIETCQKFLCFHFNLLLWLETGNIVCPKAIEQTLRLWSPKKYLILVELCELIIILACNSGKKMPKASAYDCVAHLME